MLTRCPSVGDTEELRAFSGVAALPRLFWTFPGSCGLPFCFLPLSRATLRLATESPQLVFLLWGGVFWGPLVMTTHTLLAKRVRHILVPALSSRPAGLRLWMCGWPRCFFLGGLSSKGHAALSSGLSPFPPLLALMEGVPSLLPEHLSRAFFFFFFSLFLIFFLLSPLLGRLRSPEPPA